MNSHKVVLELATKGQERADKDRVIEEVTYEGIAQQILEVPLPEILTLFRNYAAGRPTGEAFARRIAGLPDTPDFT